MKNQIAHPYQVRFGFRKATPNVSHLQTVVSVAHPKTGALLRDRSRNLAFFALFASQSAASTSLERPARACSRTRSSRACACRVSTPLISVHSNVASNASLPMNSSPTKPGCKRNISCHGGREVWALREGEQPHKELFVRHLQVSDSGGSKIHNCGSNHKAWIYSTKRTSRCTTAAIAIRCSRACQPPFPCSNACAAAHCCSFSHWALAMRHWLRTNWLSGSMAVR